MAGLELQGGYLRRIPPNASSGDQIAAINDVVDRLNDQLKSQVLSDNTSKRFIMGYREDRWPGGNFGIAISPEGSDVTAVEFEELLFAWDFSTGTMYWWDADGRQYRQDGLLPNSEYGFHVATSGQTVQEGF